MKGRERVESCVRGEKGEKRIGREVDHELRVHEGGDVVQKLKSGREDDQGESCRGKEGEKKNKY